MILTYNKQLQRYEFRIESREEKDASGRLGLAIASSARLQTSWERKNGSQAPVFHTSDIYRAYLLVAHADPDLREYILAHIESMGGLVPKLTFRNGIYIWHGPMKANGIVYKEIPKRAGLEFCNTPAALPNDAGKDFKTSVWWTASAMRAQKCLEYADDTAREAINESSARRQSALDASRAHDSDIDIPVPAGLVPFGYQRAGVAYAAKRFSDPARKVRGVLIGDEPGLGKTIQAALMINHFPEIKRVLVICPASLKRNWQRELQRWLVRPALIGIADTAYSKVIPESEIVIANFEILAKRFDTGRRKQEKGKTKILYDYRLREALSRQPWDLLIIDEAHKIKGDPKTCVRCRMCFAIPFRFCLLLTGTPIVNRPSELYNLIAHIAPKYYGDKPAFMNRHCPSSGWRRANDGADNLEELQENLRLRVMVRRRKAEVLTDLPPKLRQVIELPADGCEGLVKKEQLAFASKEEILTNVRLRVELAKASENPNDYKSAVADLKKGIQVAFEELSRIRKETAIAKIPMVQDYCDSLLESVPKLVVFAHHKEVVYTLAEHFGRECVTLTGDTKLKDRDDAVQSFQTDESIRVFIGTIGAAGVGLTLTASSYVVFSELDWVPGNVTQAEDRCHRIGTVDNVMIQHLVLEGSLDKRMADVLVEKQEIADRALDRDTKGAVLDEPITPAREQMATQGVTVQDVKKIADEMTREDIALVQYGLQLLAGAHRDSKKIDIRFRAIDAPLGTHLAQLKKMTTREAALGKKFLSYYRQSLAPLVPELQPLWEREKK